MGRFKALPMCELHSYKDGIVNNFLRAFVLQHYVYIHQFFVRNNQCCWTALNYDADFGPIIIVNERSATIKQSLVVREKEWRFSTVHRATFGRRRASWALGRLGLSTGRGIKRRVTWWPSKLSTNQRSIVFRSKFAGESSTFLTGMNLHQALLTTHTEKETRKNYMNNLFRSYKLSNYCLRNRNGNYPTV